MKVGGRTHKVRVAVEEGHRLSRATTQRRPAAQDVQGDLQVGTPLPWIMEDDNLVEHMCTYVRRATC